MRRRFRSTVPALALTLAAVTMPACAARSIPQPAAPPDQPRISWTMSVASRDRMSFDQVCRSDDPDTSEGCELPRVGGDHGTLAYLSIHLFPTGKRVRYSGAALLGFLDAGPDRPGGHETTIDYTLEPDSGVFNVGISGLIREEADISRFLVTLYAMNPESQGDPRHIQAMVPVLVR
jgi:hypothetical protein